MSPTSARTRTISLFLNFKQDTVLWDLGSYECRREVYATQQMASRVSVKSCAWGRMWGRKPSNKQNSFNFNKICEIYGGEGGVRTPGTLARTSHFECDAIDHSATVVHHHVAVNLARRLMNTTRLMRDADF